MPEAYGFSPGPPNRARGIDIIKGPRERDDPYPGAHDGSRPTDQSSITVLANSDSAISAN